uniref:protein TAPETUM DETERMINANT 1-like n=1 Tax=Erigeron canadensis TaxID=72917 RepID=UPI001CB9BC16|nr:protein TAPETUM DETERMINANT 1-like [Erigeron canadensis]
MKKTLVVITAALMLMIVIIASIPGGVLNKYGSTRMVAESTTINTTTSATPLFGLHRKLLFGHATGKVEVYPNRIWGDRCSKSDIVISQGPTAPLPSGIPTYTVEIMNACTTGCDISGIHLYCGWFSSARLINPRLFKRLHYDDCLVNGGKPLINGHTISFQYANTFPYPLSISSVVC